MGPNFQNVSGSSVAKNFYPVRLLLVLRKSIDRLCIIDLLTTLGNVVYFFIYNIVSVLQVFYICIG